METNLLRSYLLQKKRKKKQVKKFCFIKEKEIHFFL